MLVLLLCFPLSVCSWKFTGRTMLVYSSSFVMRVLVSRESRMSMLSGSASALRLIVSAIRRKPTRSKLRLSSVTSVVSAD